MLLKVSVGHRLFLLVAFQTAIATLLVITALRQVSGITADTEYLYRFQLLTLADLGRAEQQATILEMLTGPDVVMLRSRPPAQKIAGVLRQLEEIDTRYRTRRETVGVMSSEADHFRRELRQAGRFDLVEKEKEAIQVFEESLRNFKEDEHSFSIAPTEEIRWKASRVRQSVATLFNVNTEYAKIANEQVLQRARTSGSSLLAIGLIGTASTLALGLLVRRAIAPRIRRLVEKVHRFRDFGVNEKILDTVDDEIAILGNALDTGFSAIEARDRERDQFLAIAAHELKTPITSIHGFASLLATHPDDRSIADRAIESIKRQSWRLSRVVEHLLLAMGIRMGEFKFAPKPFDLSALVERSVSEIQPFFQSQVFNCRIEKSVTVLGDEALLEHGIWTLFTCASAVSSCQQLLEVELRATPSQARLTADVRGANLSAHDIQSLFRPFGSVEYENRSGIRNAVGLYLSQQIAHLHNGRLEVSDRSGTGVQLLMEIPR